MIILLGGHVRARIFFDRTWLLVDPKLGLGYPSRRGSGSKFLYACATGRALRNSGKSPCLGVFLKAGRHTVNVIKSSSWGSLGVKRGERKYSKRTLLSTVLTDQSCTALFALAQYKRNNKTKK
jgi:hypothetical protein